MDTIHDDRMGSEAAQRAALNRERRARAVLGRAKDALEVILGAGAVGYCRIVPTRRRLSANVHFKAHFGWPPDALIDRRALDERIHPQDRADLAAALHAALTEGTRLQLTVRATWPCGAVQYIALRGGAVFADHPEECARGKLKTKELVLVASNVTGEHRAIEEALAAAQHASARRVSAEAANRANLELLARVSHELRSPLNAMLGWNRILAVKRSADPEIQTITARVEHGARAQLRIVNDVLDLGLMGAGKFKIEPRPMKLATMAAVAIEGAGAAAQEKNIQITADLAVTAGEMNGDAERLRQLVAHLLSNAIKYTPPAGKVRVCLRRDGADLELEVIDSGCGIAPERLAELSRRGRAGDTSGAAFMGGLGIGLALAREIVTRHGGTMHISSDGVDRGTAVLVRLPGTAARLPAAEPAAGATVQGHAPKSLSGLGILVVDDEPDARAVVAELLRLEGAEVAVSDSAASAYEKFCAKGASFDVVVSDIGMPVEDGYSLVRKLRALKCGNRVLAVALTGLATTYDAATALAAGFDLHVAKPVDFQSFLPLIRRLSPQRAAPEAKPAQFTPGP